MNHDNPRGSGFPGRSFPAIGAGCGDTAAAALSSLSSEQVNSGFFAFFLSHREEHRVPPFVRMDVDKWRLGLIFGQWRFMRNNARRESRNATRGASESGAA